jgi:hypothetical protein
VRTTAGDRGRAAASLLVTACGCSDHSVLCGIVHFATFVQTNYSMWRFVRAPTKWLLGCRSLRILTNVLQDPCDDATLGSGGACRFTCLIPAVALSVGS